MRDIFNEISEGEPANPMESARRNMRPALRKRFYKDATVAEETGGFAVLLDGKPVRTPARRALAAPTRALADLLAAEWNAQGDTIDPAAMPLTRLANAVIDAVAAQAGAVTAEIVNYLGTDLVCYRADEPAALVAAQARVWDPVLAFARDDHGARFVLAQGVVHAAQPAAAIDAMRTAIPRDIWRLGAVSSITTLTGSGLIALMLAAGRLAPEAAWAAAHVDEDFQMQQWGRDELALARRAAREAEFRAACAVLASA
ncbi:MAG: ATP12 family chaperone protein [Pseudolabrys sp.]